MRHIIIPKLISSGETFKPTVATIGWVFKNTGNNRATIRNTYGGDAWILEPGESIDTRHDGSMDRGIYLINFTDLTIASALKNEISVSEFKQVNSEF